MMVHPATRMSSACRQQAATSRLQPPGAVCRAGSLPIQQASLHLGHALAARFPSRHLQPQPRAPACSAAGSSESRTDPPTPISATASPSSSSSDEAHRSTPAVSSAPAGTTSLATSSTPSRGTPGSSGAATGFVFIRRPSSSGDDRTTSSRDYKTELTPGNGRGNLPDTGPDLGPDAGPRPTHWTLRAGNSGGAAALSMVMPHMAPPARLRFPSLAAPITWTLMTSYILIMLIVPISALLYKAANIPLAVFLERALEPVAMHAYEVTFTMAAAAAAINMVFGFLLAWVLVKYKFPGKKWIDAAVDIPFALPTSVAGLTLSTVYGDEALLGQLLAKIGVRVVFTKLGVAVAMVFVSFPFVVRTMQPVLQEIEKELEEAAWTLGASPWHTFKDVILPPLLPSLLTGTALAFSRALGEFGSIAIIASNFAFKDLIAPVLIFQALEQYDFVGATVVGTVLLLASLTIMLLVNKLQQYGSAFRK